VGLLIDKTNTFVLLLLSNTHTLDIEKIIHQ